MTQNQPSNSPDEERLERARRFGSLFQVRPLTNASPQEVGQAALGFTQARFTVESGTPQVAFTRSLTGAELASTGLGEINFGGEEPPLMLVVVKGNFDVSNFVPSRDSGLNPLTKVKYIAYVFDLRAGRPAFIATGLTGKYFRTVLNDPSLPDEPELIGPEPGMPEAIPGPRVEPPAQKFPYGTEVPPGDSW